jgi:uncharacterized protein YkwD
MTYARAMPRIAPTIARITTLVALVGLLTVVVVAPASAVSAKTYARQVVTATNAFRSGEGLATVKRQACLDRWARGQARWMADRDRLAHRDGRLRKALRSCKLSGVSENIAYNYRSGHAAVAAWKASPGHAANLRAPRMRLIGVGVARSDDGEIYVAQMFGVRR